MSFATNKFTPWALSLLCLLSVHVWSADYPLLHRDDSEISVIKVLNHAQKGQLNEALLEAEELARSMPKFRLASLLYSDLLMRKSGNINGAFGAQNIEINALLAEAKKRWQHYEQHREDLLPNYLLELAPYQRHAIVVDLSQSRLYLYRFVKENYQLIDDYYVSAGLNGSGKLRMGDKRTPIGVYFVNDRLAEEELPDRYGVGALPISYPNEIDRIEGRTGYGIWLHGTPFDTYSRPPLDSDGCVILSNQDLTTVMQLLGNEPTPVIIANRVNWSTSASIGKQRQEFRTLMSRWERDWESRDIDSFLQHYSKEFFSGGRDYEAWALNARVSYADASFINVELRNVSMFSYPGQEMVVTTFEQSYESNNLRQSSKKRQYWKRDKFQQWKIIYEGPV